MEIDFLRRRVLTSRTVRGGRVTDLPLGGPAYQVEHSRARHLVRAFGDDHGIVCTETSLVGSSRAALQSPHELGASVRAVAQSGAVQA